MDTRPVFILSGGEWEVVHIPKHEKQFRIIVARPTFTRIDDKFMRTDRDEIEAYAVYTHEDKIEHGLVEYDYYKLEELAAKHNAKYPFSTVEANHGLMGGLGKHSCLFVRTEYVNMDRVYGLGIDRLRQAIDETMVEPEEKTND